MCHFINSDIITHLILGKNEVYQSLEHGFAKLPGLDRRNDERKSRARNGERDGEKNKAKNGIFFFSSGQSVVLTRHSTE